MVGVHRLAAQVVGPPGPAGAVQMAVLRVSVAHTLSGVAAILFELFGSFGTVFSGPLGRFLQPLLPVGVQTVSIIPWALLELHQLLRGTGGIGLHIKSVPKPTGHRAVWDTLAYYFLKQPPEALAEGGLPPPQLGDGTVVRHPVQEVQAQVRPNWGLCQRLHRGQKCQRVWGHPNKHFCGAKTSSVYTLALLDTNVHPTNLRKCKKSNYLPILDVFKDFATIVVDDSPNHNRNLRKILIFSHVRLNNYNIPFYYNMWRTMQRRSEVSCRTKY